MTSDPIISLFVIVFRRALLFVILGGAIALSVWCWLLTSKFDVPVSELPTWLREAWTPLNSIVPAVFLYGALIIGILSASVIYLVIGCYWKKRATVRHHRGAHLDDSEE